MKITCKSCGHENLLGRMFCVNCGVRLDLSCATVEDIHKGQETDRRHVWVRLAVWVVVTVLLVIVGLAAWPQRMRKTESAPNGERRIVYAADLLASGRYVALRLEPKDINGYLQAKARGAGISALNAELEDGKMTLLAVKAWGPWRVQKYYLGPVRFTWEFAAAPVGRDLHINRGAVGHLPIFGPPARFLAKRTFALFPNTDLERQVLAKLKEARVLAEGVEIVVEK